MQKRERALITLLLVLVASAVPVGGCGEPAHPAETETNDAAAALLREMPAYESPETAFAAWAAARRANDWQWVRRCISEAGLREMAAAEIAAYRQAGQALGLGALGIEEATADADAAVEAQVAKRMATESSVEELLLTLDAMQQTRGDEGVPPLARDGLELAQLIHGNDDKSRAVARITQAESGRTLGWIALRRLEPNDHATGDNGGAAATWVVDGLPVVRSRIRGASLVEALPDSHGDDATDTAKQVRATFLGTTVADELQLTLDTPTARYLIIEPGAQLAKVQLHNDGDAALTTVTLRLTGYDIRREPIGTFTHNVTHTIKSGTTQTVELAKAINANLPTAAYLRANVTSTR